MLGELRLRAWLGAEVSRVEPVDVLRLSRKLGGLNRAAGKKLFDGARLGHSREDFAVRLVRLPEPLRLDTHLRVGEVGLQPVWRRRCACPERSRRLARLVCRTLRRKIIALWLFARLGGTPGACWPRFARRPVASAIGRGASGCRGASAPPGAGLWRARRIHPQDFFIAGVRASLPYERGMLSWLHFVLLVASAAEAKPALHCVTVALPHHPSAGARQGGQQRGRERWRSPVGFRSWPSARDRHWPSVCTLRVPPRDCPEIRRWERACPQAA